MKKVVLRETKHKGGRLLIRGGDYIYIYIYIYICGTLNTTCYVCTYNVYTGVSLSLYIYRYMYTHIYVIYIYIYIYIYIIICITYTYILCVRAGAGSAATVHGLYAATVVVLPGDHTNPPHPHKSDVNQSKQCKLQ